MALHINTVEDYHEISSPSISVHPEDVKSNEATDTFFDMLSCADLDVEQLDDEQTSKLKEATATIRAL